MSCQGRKREGPVLPEGPAMKKVASSTSTFAVRVGRSCGE